VKSGGDGDLFASGSAAVGMMGEIVIVDLQQGPKSQSSTCFDEMNKQLT